MARQLINTYCIVWKYAWIYYHDFKVRISILGLGVRDQIMGV